MQKRFYFLSAVFVAFVFFFSCKKQNENPNWDVNVLAPFFKATLNIGNLIPDSLKQVEGDGSVNVVYSGNIYSTPIDSFFELNDTLIRSTFQIPVAVSIPAGLTFYNTDKTVDLDIGDVELKFAIIKSGFAHLIAYNHLSNKIIYTFTIPKASLSGTPFIEEVTVDAATSSGPGKFDGLFDISGYDVDLTGINGNNYNTIAYNVVAKSDAAGDTVFTNANDTLVDVLTGFKDLLPRYGRGYLGEGSISVDNEEKQIAATKFIQSGTILFDSVSARLSITNNVGVDAQAKISSMKSVNSRTGDTVNLISSSVINHTININRASETGPPISPVNPTYYSLQMNNVNSNIIPFIENIPDEVFYSVDFILNPLGNISGSHDFIYTEKLFDAKLDFNFPLRFGASQLSFSDTVKAEINNPEDYDAVGSGTFTLVAYNGFPWELGAELTLLDENNNATDNIIVGGKILPAPLDATNRAIGKKRSEIKIVVDEERKKRILSAKRMMVSAKFSTANYPSVLQIYSDYSLDLKLVGDIQYLIH